VFYTFLRYIYSNIDKKYLHKHYNMIPFTIIVDLIILILTITGNLTKPDIIFTLLSMSFGVGFAGTVMMNGFYEGMVKKHNLNTFSRIALDVVIHILPMWYMYWVSKEVPLDNNKIVIYLIVSIMLPIIYSRFIDSDKVYPEVPTEMFYIMYPIGAVVPFLWRHFNNK
jgi:hypothetical protein